MNRYFCITFGLMENNDVSMKENRKSSVWRIGHDSLENEFLKWLYRVGETI